MPKENHYAIVVGIDEYPDYHNGTKNLHCPQKDALKVRDWLLRPDGGDLPPGSESGASPNLSVITREIPAGRQAPRPIVNEIIKAVGQTATTFFDKYALLGDAEREAMWRSGRLYLYFSGHGLDATGNDAVLLSADAAAGSLFHLSLLDLVNRLKVARTFREIVVWADCCRTGSGVTIAPVLLDRTSFTYDGPGEVSIFFARASKTQQLAFEPPVEKLAEIPNSLFTHALVERLSGALPGALPGAAQGVRSRDLVEYLKWRVPDLSQRYCTAVQEPDFEPNDDIELVTSAIAPTTFTIRFAAKDGSPFAGQTSVEILSHLDAAGGPTKHPVSTVSAGLFEAALPMGLYELRLLNGSGPPVKFGFPVFGTNMTLEI